MAFLNTPRCSFSRSSWLHLARPRYSTIPTTDLDCPALGIQRWASLHLFHLPSFPLLPASVCGCPSLPLSPQFQELPISLPKLSPPLPRLPVLDSLSPQPMDTSLQTALPISAPYLYPRENLNCFPFWRWPISLAHGSLGTDFSNIFYTRLLLYLPMSLLLPLINVLKRTTLLSALALI